MSYGKQIETNRQTSKSELSPDAILTSRIPIDRTGRLYYFAGIIVSDPVGLTLKVHDSQESKTLAQF
jgi:hypothetical protein